MEWQREAVADGALRAVAADGLHVTVAFLGSRPPDRVEGIWAAARGAAEGLAVPRFVPGDVVAVPPRRPRLFALDLADPEGLGERMQSAVAAALEEAGEYEPEERPFWPHVTIARVRRGARARPPAAAPALEPFSPPALTLFRSHTSSKGARYEALERLVLGRGSKRPACRPGGRPRANHGHCRICQAEADISNTRPRSSARESRRSAACDLLAQSRSNRHIRHPHRPIRHLACSFQRT